MIFDCDGTLVDSEYICNLGLEIKLAEYGVDSSANEMMKRFRGFKLAAILEILQREYQIELEDNFVSSYRDLVDELFHQDLQVCDGVHEMLAEISQSKCVASSGPINKIRSALAITNITHYFNGNLFSSYEIGSWKPDPGIFLHAAKEMGVQPHDCAVIEDSPVGIAAAKTAGMFPVLYDPDNLHISIKGVRRIQHMEQLRSAIT